ncbi:hypothetical protein TRIATDRAFT_162337, partial [Trichoderma atroviride IMI 206040]
RPKVSVRVMDFEHFKNRYGIDDKYHIIEVLRATPQMTDEIQDEWNRRKETANATKLKTSAVENSMPSDIERIQRVRIQSTMILGYLSHVAGNLGWDIEKPRVFCWPFRALSHYYPEMKQHLDILEERWGEATPPEDFGYFKDAPAKEYSSDDEYASVDQKNSDNRKDGVNKKAILEDEDNTDTDANNGDGDIDISDPKLNDPTALRHMRCYIKFMEQIILPLEQATRDYFVKSGRIKSNDLWHLFQIGDIICAPSRAISQQQTAFIIYRKAIPPIADDYPDDFNNRGLIIWCYYVDNDGNRYDMVEEMFNIDGYEGEKTITSLPIFPLHYAHDYEPRLTTLEKQGEHFKAMVKEKHVYCQGWTLPDNPIGKKTVERQNLAYSPPEYVDSDVIIDIKEALNQNPDWKLGFGLSYGVLGDDPWLNGDDKMEICHWNSDKRTQLLVSRPEKIQRSEGVGDAMFQRWEEDTNPAGPHDIEDGRGNIIRSASLVLPHRFFAYVLRDRRFASVDVMTMEKIPPQESIFDDLEIDHKNKQMVKSLVASHFEKRELQKARPGLGSMNQDLIRGKGLGLFILLHGVPGVGKTATAEAVAQANGKPLFTITCGDLGFTPKEVEEELNGIFRLANLWDCVLLLDEADVFLARRDSWNLKRNALVSVFLRVLEYYSGILFLTTNRVGTMDEAFKSRIHVSLYYEPLTLAQTEKIFEVNIEKLKRMELEREQKLAGTGIRHQKLIINRDSIMNWARNYYKQAQITSESAQWNGRQIRNAFQIASSLARYDTAKSALEKGKMPSPVLNRKQFEMVADTINKFDQYMQFATGKADSD